MEWFSKSKGKKSPNNHASSSPVSSPSFGASSGPAIGVPYEPPRRVGKPLDVGFTKNKNGKLVVGDVKVGQIGAKAIGTHGARIGFHSNEGGDHKVGNVTID
ncbi:hypothetical protein RND81_14G243600 [Saponaria officinalis]|uniref:Uncharacterized protein n=1 Tax=Saponaria officinalis TaxID=3572 RepID=A0AAW1GZX8_SAPOF